MSEYVIINLTDITLDPVYLQQRVEEGAMNTTFAIVSFRGLIPNNDEEFRIPSVL